MERTTRVGRNGRIEATGEYAEACAAAARFVEERRMPGQSFHLALNSLVYYEGTDPYSCELGRRFGLAAADVDHIRLAGGYGTV